MIRRLLFVYDIGVVIFLAIVAVAYLRYTGSIDLPSLNAPPASGSPPPPSSDHALVLLKQYRLAVECLWFGALGGVVISLKGIYDHPATASDGWKHNFNLWHLGRPVSGAITGFITYVLLSAINPAVDPNAPVLYAAAFILGTQESRFFNFLFEVGRIVVQVPQQESTGLKVTDIQPSQGKGDEVLVVRGQGFARGVVIKIGDATLKGVSVASDGVAAAGILPAGAAGSADVVVANPDGATVVLPGRFTYVS